MQDDAELHDRPRSKSVDPATFVVTNIGAMVDSLQIFTDEPHARGATPELKPGQTARLTVRSTEKGIAYYQSGTYPPGEPEFGGGDADGGTFNVG